MEDSDFGFLPNPFCLVALIAFLRFFWFFCCFFVWFFWWVYGWVGWLIEAHVGISCSLSRFLTPTGLKPKWRLCRHGNNVKCYALRLRCCAQVKSSDITSWSIYDPTFSCARSPSIACVCTINRRTFQAIKS